MIEASKQKIIREYKTLLDNYFLETGCNKLSRDKYRSISIGDFVNNVNEEYSIDLTYDVVKGYVYGLSNIYYSQILDKLYVDKEDFYKEIYDE